MDNNTNIFEDFQSLDGGETVGNGAVEQNITDKATPVSPKAKKKERIAKMKDSILETAAQDPEFDEKLRSLSNSIEVVNSLGFGDKGNIVLDESVKDAEIDPKTNKPKRAIDVTSQIVGYRVRNIGSEPIQYQTEVYTQGEDGIYVGTKTTKVIEPGATADLTRFYMTRFCAQPEISFQLANGKIIRGSGSKGGKDFKAELESYYFRFNKDENGEKKQINDDTVKLNVGEKVDGKWVVKPDFVETFGYLNNPSKGRTKSKDKYNNQDIAANFVNRMIIEAGL